MFILQILLNRSTNKVTPIVTRHLHTSIGISTTFFSFTSKLHPPLNFVFALIFHFHLRELLLCPLQHFHVLYYIAHQNTSSIDPWCSRPELECSYSYSKYTLPYLCHQFLLVLVMDAPKPSTLQVYSRR